MIDAETETAPEINADLAREVMAWIAEHPKEHDQSTWARRTRSNTAAEWKVTLCAGAAACVLAGAELVWNDGEYTAYAAYVTPESLPEHARGSDREMTYMGYAARRLLGIDEDTACRLFFHADTLDEIRAILEPLITTSGNN